MEIDDLDSLQSAVRSGAMKVSPPLSSSELDTDDVSSSEITCSSTLNVSTGWSVLSVSHG
jgi:hypothetical protein